MGTTVDYTQIGMRSFIRFSSILPCDIYVRLGEERFTRIFMQGFPLDLKRFNSYRQRGTKALWIQSPDFKKYLGGIRESLISNSYSEGVYKGAALDLVEELACQSLSLITNSHSIDLKTYQCICTSVDILVRMTEDDLFGAAELLKSVKKRSRLFRHLISTSIFSLLLAKADGNTNPKTLSLIGTAGLLHDLGLAHLFDEFDEHASPPETAHTPQIQQHPRWLTTRISGGSRLPAEIRIAIAQHHESWNGKGYPNKLSGEKIYYPARILSVADIFSSLSTGSSTRAALPPRLALFDLKKNSALDPNLVSVFCNLFQG